MQSRCVPVHLPAKPGLDRDRTLQARAGDEGAKAHREQPSDTSANGLLEDESSALRSVAPADRQPISTRKHVGPEQPLEVVPRLRLDPDQLELARAAVVCGSTSARDDTAANAGVDRPDGIALSVRRDSGRAFGTRPVQDRTRTTERRCRPYCAERSHRCEPMSIPRTLSKVSVRIPARRPRTGTS